MHHVYIFSHRLKKYFSTKLPAFLLAFLFIFSPVAQIFAEEVSQSSTAENIETQAPEINQTETTPTPEPEPQSQESNSSQSLSQAPISSSTANTNLPPSSIKVLLPEADQTTGALVYSYPIAIPSGRNGLQPDLGLTYNSQNMQEGSIFGSGWSVNIPQIERINRKGSEKLYTENYFSSSLDSELVEVFSNVYAPKVENGSFNKYEFSNNIWTVTDKKGTVYKFGQTAVSRQDDPNDSTKVYTWTLEEIRDTNDNYIKYEYYKDDGQIYPSRIIYTGNGITDGIFEINFLRQSRTDIAPINKTGFSVSTNYRVYEVDIKTSGILTHKYEISYTTGDNGVRSLVNSITESGINQATGIITTLPPTSFSYQTSTAGWTQDTSLTVPVTFVWPSGQDAAVRILDVNSDGLQDLVVSSGSSGVKSVYLNNGGGWVEDTSWVIPEYIVDAGNSDTGFRFLDINGDNLPDIILSRLWDYNGDNTKHVYINNGSGWVEDFTWTIPVYFSIPGGVDPGSRIADINGDGLPDLLVSERMSDTQKVYINNGTNWVYDQAWVIPMYFTNIFSRDEGTILTDINGDGQADILWSNNALSMKSVYINTGTGWTEDTTWGTIPEYFLDGSRKDRGVRFADINSDGLMDILISYLVQDNQYGRTEEKHVYINTGKGWTENTSITIPVFFVDPGNGDTGARISDNKGSNLSGIILSKHLQPNLDQKEAYNKNGKRSDLLSRITYSTGGTTDITYKSSTQYKDGSTISNPNLPFAFDTVHQLSTNDNNGNISTTTYDYENGKYYFNTPFDRKFAGFGAITKIDSVGNTVKTYFHQGDATNSSQGEYDDHSSKIGKPYLIEFADASGNIYSRTINKWEKTSLGTGRDFIYQSQKIDMVYDGNATHKDIATEYTYDTVNGNLLTQVNRGEVNALLNGTFTDTGSDMSTATYTYNQNTSTNVYAPQNIIVTDGLSNKIQESKYYYDALAYGSISKGNPTKVENWKSGTSYISTEKTYNNYGLVTSDKDARGKITSYTYDSNNLYPITITNPLNHTIQYTHDSSTGKVLTTTDQNGVVYINTYDGLGRIKEEKIPGTIAPYSPVLKTDYVYTDTSGAVAIQKTEYLDASNTVDTYQYFDGLNRLTQERTEAEMAGDFNVRDIIYNNLGLLEKESLKYQSTGSVKTTPTTIQALYTSNTYDLLQRVLTATNASGTTSNIYDGWKVSITDAKGNVKNFYKDAYGNLIKVEEKNGTSTYTTLYEWNLNQKLTKITDALGNIRNFTYDALGQRLTAEDLHTPTDTTFGTWTYTYDDAGNITQTTNPRGQIITSTYDDLNRILTESVTGAPLVGAIYVYDVCLNGIGKLCNALVKEGSTNTAYAYDSRGGVALETKTISAIAYPTSYTYNHQNNILSITTPDLAVTQYTYNQGGLLEKIEVKEAGGAFANIISNFDYNPMGQITTQNFANGVITTNTYDSANLYRLTRRLTQNSALEKLQDLNYTYDNVGNITQIIDSSNTNGAKTSVFAYDDLYRLISTTVTNSANAQNYAQAYTYDALGNILTGPAGAYLYQGSTGTSKANSHAVTSINGAVITYDNDGNVLTSGALTNTWNYRDQLSQTIKQTPSVVISVPEVLVSGMSLSAVPVKNSLLNTRTFESASTAKIIQPINVSVPITMNYYYDHTGSRVWYKVDAVSTYYPNKFYNTSGTKKTKKIFAGNTLVASIETVISGMTPVLEIKTLSSLTSLGGSSVGGVTTPTKTITLYYVHTDHVLGSSVISNQSGTKVELLDYYPFGQIRLDEKTGSFSEQRKFGGHIYDQETDLNYLGARYYNGTWGRFASQDSMFWSLPDSYLLDPQQQNSYSYARNNPVVYVDPDGNSAQLPAGLISVYQSIKQIFTNAFGGQKNNSTPAQVTTPTPKAQQAQTSKVGPGDYPGDGHIKSDYIKITFDPGADNSLNQKAVNGYEQIFEQASQRGITSVNFSSTARLDKEKFSWHNYGLAGDINIVNGIHVSKDNSYAKTLQNVIDKTPGVRENFGPFIINHSSKVYSMEQYDTLSKGHQDHVHTSFNK
ncbi:MAG: FG-GAP-like repeat-containing protein [Candidatus Paceibacterota bacterium]|jgi:RHS repeat-associated protein